MFKAEEFMELPKNKLTVLDVVVMLILAVAAAVFLIRGVTAPAAEVFVITTPDSSETHPLSHPASFTVTSNGYNLTIMLEDGKVRVENSDCPDHTCQNSGSISKRGESIVCVPAEVVISIPSDSSAETNEDFIIG